MAMDELGALIEEVKRAFLDRHGVELSNQDIARRSGGVMTRGRVQQLEKTGVKAMPGPDVIMGLARGLEVPASLVLERALLAAGYGAAMPRAQHEERTLRLAARRGKPELPAD